MRAKTLVIENTQVHVQVIEPEVDLAPVYRTSKDHNAAWVSEKKRASGHIEDVYHTSCIRDAMKRLHVPPTETGDVTIEYLGNFQYRIGMLGQSIVIVI